MSPAPQDLTEKHNLKARSTPDIVEAFTRLVAAMAKDDELVYVRFGEGKKVHKAAVMNALVMWVTSRPVSEQRAIIAQGLALLNDHMNPAPDIAANEKEKEMGEQGVARKAPKRRRAHG